MDYASLSVFAGFVYWMLGDYYTNWLQPPPGVSHKAWVPIFCEIPSNYLDIRVAGRNLITTVADWLCEKHNSSVSGVYPTLKDVYHVIRSKKYPAVSHLARYQETILNRLEGLLAVFGDHICSQRRLDWNIFHNTNWAISLYGIPTDYQNLFITVTTAKILVYRMANNLRSSGLVDLLVFDEGSTMFRKWYESREGTYLLTDYLAKCREFGIGFVIGTQTLSNLADSVLANTSIKILVGGAGLGADYNIFASATGMTPEQTEFIKRFTMPGQAYGKDPRYPYPFTLEVPRIA